VFIGNLITVSKVKSLHCSEQQLPAADSGDDELQQVTTLHYCRKNRIDCFIRILGKCSVRVSQSSDCSIRVYGFFMKSFYNASITGIISSIMLNIILA